MAVIYHLYLSARVTIEEFFHTSSTQMCGKPSFTRASGESEYPRQESQVKNLFVFHWSGKVSKGQTVRFHLNNITSQNLT